VCGKEKGPIVQGGRGRIEGGERKGGSEGKGKRVGRLGKGDSLIDRKSFDWSALQCFGISGFSISKVDILEGSIEGKHLVITCSLTIHDQVIQKHALIDCRATGNAFMDQDFARHHDVPLKELKERRQVKVIDGRTLESGDITHQVEVGMNIQDHKERIPMFITKLGQYPIVLGIQWLRLLDVAVRFTSNTVTFGSQYCVNHCQNASVTVQGVTEDPPEKYMRKRNSGPETFGNQNLFEVIYLC